MLRGKFNAALRSLLQSPQILSVAIPDVVHISVLAVKDLYHSVVSCPVSLILPVFTVVFRRCVKLSQSVSRKL